MAKIAASLFRGYRRRSRNHTLELVRSLSEIGGSHFTRLRSLVEVSDWTTIFEGNEIDPRSYSSASDFSVDYLASVILSKYPVKGYKDESELRNEALRKFRESEVACLETNRRLLGDRSVPLCGNTADAVIHTAARKISSLLGDFSWDDAERYMGFGPGATYSLPRKKGDLYYKFGAIPETTANCGLLALCAVASSARWYGFEAARQGGPVHPGLFQYVPGNRITTVPKNAKTDRCIAIEPLMNMYVQKGIGGLIRRRLRRVGIDLDDQTINQRGALLGSLDGSLATLDLKSASDSVSLELCRALLPPDWMEALERCRSPVGVLPDGTQIRYQKVSSMGNGFTFELESLLFWAISRAVGELTPRNRDRRLFIYGDDIVIPTGLVGPLTEALNYFGFELNKEKSFWDGPFRESCGKHYFNGVDVTPFYIREDVDTVRRLYWFHNQFILWLNRLHGDTPVLLRDSPEYRLVCLAESLVPKKFRCFRIPYGSPDNGEYLGDIGLVSTFDDARPYQTNYFGSYSLLGIGTSSVIRFKGDDQYLTRQLFSLRRKPASGVGAKTGKTPQGVPGFERVKLIGCKPGSLVTFGWKDPYMVV